LAARDNPLAMPEHKTSGSSKVVLPRKDLRKGKTTI